MGTGGSALGLRYTAALDAMRLRPGDRVVEVGCGHGVALAEIAGRVGPTGRVHAIDRSPAMVGAARERKASAAAEGGVVIEQARIQDAVLPDASFDWVLAVRVADVWREAATVLPPICRWLRPGGGLCLAIDAPSQARLESLVEEATDALLTQDLAIAARHAHLDQRLVVLTARRPA